MVKKAKEKIRGCGRPGRWDEAMLLPVGGQRCPSEVDMGAGTRRKGGSKPDLLTWSSLRGLFRWPDRAGRQGRLLSNEEGWLPC